MASSGQRLTLAADGQTSAVTTTGPVHVSLTGTFGGGTAKLQVQDPADNWIDVAGTSKTAVDDYTISFPAGSKSVVRIDISGSTTPALVIVIKHGVYS